MTIRPLAQAAACCLACGDTRPSTALAQTHYGECLGCGLLVSEAEEGSYQAGYYFHDEKFDAENRRRARMQWRWLEQLEPKASRPGLRLLEVGCAKGDFVAAARSRGLLAHGLDVSDPAITAAQQRGRGDYCLQGRLQVGTPLPTPRSPETLVAWELIEHFDDPRPFVAAAFEALAPGGYFLGSTPNASSTWRRWLGTGWHGYGIPEYHRMLFSTQGLTYLLEGQGFVEVRTLSRTQVQGGHLLLKNAATVLTQRLFRTRNRVLRTALAAVLWPLEKTLEVLSGRAPGLDGDTLLFVARRPPR